MQNNHMFSVAMTVYKNDKPRYFEKALNSIIDQTIVPDEIILVVDGPVNDELKSIIDKYELRYNFFKPIYLDENAGLGIALKIAIENCSYDLIARMDSDDISRNDRFEKQIKCFETNDSIDIAGGIIEEFVGDESNIVGKRVVPLDNSEIVEYLKKRCPFNHMTVMFKKDAVLKSGNYLDWFWNEDYYLWIRMYEHGCIFSNLSDPLVYVRVGKDMYKRRGGIKYFMSEAKLQKYMLDHKIIRIPRFLFNVAIRFTLQIIIRGKLRALIFKKLARKGV